MNNSSPLRKNRHTLADIGNKIVNSPPKNVFRRLGTSPIKKYSNDLGKPPMRLSPVKRKPPQENVMNFQTTPKRLRSPRSLKEFTREGTLSVDRINFKNSEHPQISATDFVFPTSPVRAKFSNSMSVGGDGSLSRIRARFGGGLRSPQKHSQEPFVQPSEKVQQNLITKLMEDDASSSPNNGMLDATRINTTINSMTMHENENSFKIRKPKAMMKRKRVKFNLAEGDKDIKSELEEIKSLLTHLMNRQEQLELKLSTLHGANILKEE